MTVSKINDDFSVSPQLTPAEIPDVAARGFVAVICNRPDGEDTGQPCAEDIAKACAEYGIEFHYLPVSGLPPSQDVIRKLNSVLDRSSGPVLGYCRSGQRSRRIYEAGGREQV